MQDLFPKPLTGAGSPGERLSRLKDLSTRSVITVLVALSALLSPGCDSANELMIPTVFLVAGQVADPTTDPFTGLVGATVSVETALTVPVATTDAEGNFILQGLPPGSHRLVARLAGRRTTLSINLVVDRNLVDVGLPMFTDTQIDSILLANGSPAWDRQFALFGIFALRSTGVPLGDATVALSPDPVATLVQTGQGEDPIVWVNANPGSYSLSVARSGFLWQDPFGVSLRAGTLTFGVPRALPNISGFVFSDRLTGSPVSGATVFLPIGGSGRTTSTDFLGQFNFVGVPRGEHVLRLSTTGFLQGLTWPQQVEEDTTLSFAMIHGDTLESWSLAGGGPLLEPTRGHLVIELRAAIGGTPLVGAMLSADADADSSVVSLPQTAGRSALLVNLKEGSYTVTIMDSGAGVISTTQGVPVAPATVTFTRLDL